MNIFKKTAIALTGMAVIFFGVNSASAESLKELEAKWGTPHSVKVMADGVERRIYGEKDVEIGYFYFMVKNGQVVDSGTTQTIDKVVKTTNTHKLSGLMSSYFKTNKTKVADLTAKYGEPVNKSTYDNGMERLVYGPADAEAGYNVFVVMNGTVIDQGRTNILVEDAKEVDGPYVSPFMANWYKNHPKNLAFLNKKYGKAVSVKEYKNGLKKMVFGSKDSETGYNFFIIKNEQVIDRGFQNSQS
ncbi:MAG: hypothetical protein GY714_14900 [Desulfobacterales bacterium]|nr:hypothetical protein [Desulfobacterales bacterium]MCP4164018.1 hypothetical protein [Deltaproteobacteria bacterium]